MRVGVDLVMDAQKRGWLTWNADWGEWSDPQHNVNQGLASVGKLRQGDRLEGQTDPLVVY